MDILQSIAAALTPTGLLWTIIILSVATFLHELAHYALARWQGVAVKSFSVGMGPIIFKRQWKETEWRISLLPLGGYVEIDGMAPVEGPDNQLHAPKHGFAALPHWGRLAVLFAGPLMNLFLAMLLMTVSFTSQGMPTPDRTRIERVLKDSKAEQLGIKAGDVIVAINGKDIPESFKVEEQSLPGWQQLSKTLKENGPHTLTYERGDKRGDLIFDWTPLKNGKKQLLGVQFGPDSQPVGLIKAASTSVETTLQAAPLVVNAFGKLIGNFLTLNIQDDENVSGPIRTTEYVSRAAELGPWALVQIAIIINLSLAFFNLMPIPGLDGGRMLMVIFSAIRGRPFSLKQEQIIHLAGFVFVIMLMSFVFIRDLARFF